MQNFVPALLRLSIRPAYWRIAVILPGRILWRTYSREEYPTPDDAVARCLARLKEPPKQSEQQAEQNTARCQSLACGPGERPTEGESARHGKPKPEHRLPAIEGDEATQHPRPLPPVRVRAAWWGWL